MADQYPHLNLAPITEALLDVRVELPPETSLDQLEGFAQAVRPHYPVVRKIERAQTQFQIGPDATDAASVQRHVLGYIYWSADKTRAVQARLDGFSVNHVKQYADWDALRADARRWWDEYLQAAKPKKVVRCALRYINRLVVPAQLRPADLLRTRVELPPELPQPPEDFFVRVVMPFEEGRMAAIVQALDARNEAGTERGLILDIDAFVQRDLGLGEDMWAEFEALREIKNKCFFESLQRSAWEAYR